MRAIENGNQEMSVRIPLQRIYETVAEHRVAVYDSSDGNREPLRSAADTRALSFRGQERPIIIEDLPRFRHRGHDAHLHRRDDHAFWNLRTLVKVARWHKVDEASCLVSEFEIQ